MGRELAVVLEFNGVAIQADGDKRFSITDVWKATGSKANKRPVDWMKTDAAKEFIEALARELEVVPDHFIKSKRGKNIGGTWAHWQVMLAYAKWVSPEFHIFANDAVRQWIEEDRDPGLKLDRAVDRMKAAGRTARWIRERLDGKLARNELTGTMADHNCRHAGGFNPYAAATRSVTLTACGRTPREIKADAGVPARISSRDHMSEVELARLRLLELESAETIKVRAADGNDECLSAVSDVCGMYKPAFAASDARRIG